MLKPKICLFNDRGPSSLSRWIHSYSAAWTWCMWVFATQICCDIFIPKTPQRTQVVIAFGTIPRFSQWPLVRYCIFLLDWDITFLCVCTDVFFIHVFHCKLRQGFSVGIVHKVIKSLVQIFSTLVCTGAYCCYWNSLALSHFIWH